MSDTFSPGVAIIGCGLIGRKRAQALGPARLVACADKVIERAKSLAAEFPNAVVSNWQDAIQNPQADIVIVATTNDFLAPITLAALRAGKHVLVEKPAARSSAELMPAVEAARQMNRLVRVGFNHRCHPALRKAHELSEAGALGELMFIRGRYGHGGRVGYEKEWRANPDISGGGEMIDQGVHMIDLARCFLGDFIEVDGFAHTYFWNMPVDDNGFMLLKTERQQMAFLHVTCTEWKNLFSLEIYGKACKDCTSRDWAAAMGLSGWSYYKMLPENGSARKRQFGNIPMGDRFLVDRVCMSFWRIYVWAGHPAANLQDARAALEIVEKIYSAVVRFTHNGEANEKKP